MRCEYCGRRFAESDLLALHRGLAHAGRLTDGEREAFETAYAGEEEGLRLFRLKALLALMALYFLLLFAYSIFG
ncbi:DNA-binding protein [Halobacteriales archaeon QS_3_64_16]|nr:MAG: DNA-binding protein [Halobacteriales archaeon QS_3_64_16]